MNLRTKFDTDEKWERYRGDKPKVS